MFTPSDGEKARWRYCYEMVEQRDPGDGIPYREIEELLGVTRQVAQAAMARAKRRLERDGKRTIATKAKYGWVVLDAYGHMAESDRYQNRTVEYARRRVHVLTGAANHRSELAADDQRHLDMRLAHSQALQEVLGRRKTPLSRLLERRSIEGDREGEHR